ncbi:MAG: tRNA (adenosine(37)-N6)-dimethylallyltransferase MiaA [Candidatus Margulisiibacteriota bacterium]|nr:MAG: tRNA (adenosine(37)-N6)-dimethylallyltransferase MiaA [Candidatus Margulisbacteria bacterium GWD2_39_127]OGI03922.1 MAG: tRNA (adenosine(37)-N6)-dimethylallyltransferase MiaA [Candidatus Margulisbacteria bacterium GWF2_38_17]OGI08192.1 MAG: tRNA (adenosine(37)-N6)-dimethylallyltransferase MiaA [Candidatus Margulisbacteria bacterium GWE2_39_32]PZM78606.1 MAG: tRNA (adenosine(37)-N6)-dimethylallyltransferase MiaA [Candidatus Margulisiibacteriota bacterium]HAR61945.1 tRNA (adenosine(37)-N6
MNSAIKIIIGATAVGKTNWAIEYARANNAEIISADSMQVYRYMDIGTAKPSITEREEIRHHLIDIVNPEDIYSAHDFVEKANILIADIRQRNKEPLLVGGTGLYINAFIRNFNFPGAPKDPNLRNKLKQRAAIEGIESLYNELKEIDEESTKKISANDLYRIIRALEVYYLTGEKISDFHYKTKSYRPDIDIHHLQKDRSAIYKGIEDRIDSMIAKGLFEEVQMLIDKGYSQDLPSMQALGYKEVIDYFLKKTDKEACISLIKKRTRNFAKRQLTWFRSFPVKKEIFI